MFAEKQIGFVDAPYKKQDVKFAERMQCAIMRNWNRRLCYIKGRKR